MIQLTLFTTAGCHLCEIADELLRTLHDRVELDVQLTEIGDDEALVNQYGTRIPVLRFPDETELNWPFAEQDIINQISKLSS